MSTKLLDQLDAAYAQAERAEAAAAHNHTCYTMACKDHAATNGALEDWIKIAKKNQALAQKLEELLRELMGLVGDGLGWREDRHLSERQRIIEGIESCMNRADDILKEINP